MIDTRGGFFLIAGPCVIESRDAAFRLAQSLRTLCALHRIPFIFKASFDKANRSSVASFRGPGLEAGLRILAEIREDLDICVLSDIHEPAQAGPAAESLDVIQIPALLSRQTDLIAAAGRTRSVLNLKKGQWMSADDMHAAAVKALAAGASDLIITERGTTFGYQNVVVDVRSIPAMRRWGFPVVIDASHTVQAPGALGARSGGDRRLTPAVALAGLAAGADGLFIEVHPDPDHALSDGPSSFPLHELSGLLAKAAKVYEAVR